MRIAYVTTASKSVPNPAYLERHRNRMKELGYDFEEIDIDGKDESSLKELLKNKDIIFVEGGNTFYLLKAIRESGFDKVIGELLDSGAVYIGSSAGSYVACPTIEMATWKHQDKYDRCNITDLTAMNLVSFLVTAHYNEEYRELLTEKIRSCQYPVRILTDDQALLIQNENIVLIGNGEEIKL